MKPLKNCIFALSLLTSGCIAAGDEGAAASYHLARTLRGTDVRCVVAESDFVLTSPFGAGMTAELVRPRCSSSRTSTPGSRYGRPGTDQSPKAGAPASPLAAM